MLTMENVVRKNNEGVEFNSVIVFGTGRLTADISLKTVNAQGEDKFVTDGQSAIAFDTFRDGKKETVFLNVEAWEQKADILSKYGTKGRRIAVTGKYKESKWKNEQDEEKMRKLIVVEQFEFLDFVENGKKESEGEPQGQVPAGFQPADDEDIPF